MKRRGGIAIALVAVVAAALASTAGAGSTAAAKTQAVSCKSTLKIAFTAPFTGGAGFLGNEQLSWAKYAVKTLAPKYGLKIKLITGDTPVEQGPAIAQTLAQKFIADKTVVAVIGPSTSGAVAASSQTFFAGRHRAHLAVGDAHVADEGRRRRRRRRRSSASSRATTSRARRTPNFMIDKLVPRTSCSFDFQEPYSQGLADAAEVVLKAKGVSTTRQSVANTVTDFSSFVTKVPSDADFVFFPTQKPADAQNFAQQLIEQGKKAKVFGGDGSNDAWQFKVPGSYVSNFAPDISGFAVQQGDHRRLEEGQPGRDARLVRSSDLPRRAGRAQRDQAGVRRGQGSDQGPPRRRPQRQEDRHQELDPRWRLPLLDEVERPAERRSSTSSRSSRTARTSSSASRQRDRSRAARPAGRAAPRVPISLPR